VAIKSMTGYGRGAAASGGWKVEASIRSVNNRFLKVSVRLPWWADAVQERVRRTVSGRIARGTVDVSIEMEPSDGVASSGLNAAAAEAHVKALRELAARLHLAGDVDVNAVSQLPGVFEKAGRGLDEEEIWGAVAPALSEALEALEISREGEGRVLAQDIRTRGAEVRRLVDGIRRDAPRTVELMRDRVRGQVSKLLEGTGVKVDGGRLEEEVAYLAQRCDIAEELTRLESHLDRLDRTLASGGEVGKELDFIVQEINREVNTVGSKAGDVGISGAVIEAKREIEKIREQLQNLE